MSIEKADLNTSRIDTITFTPNRKKLWPIIVSLLVVFFVITTVFLLFSQTAEQLQRDKYYAAIYSIICNILLASFFTFFLTRHGQKKSKKTEVIAEDIKQFSMLFNRTFSVAGLKKAGFDHFASMRRLKTLLLLISSLVREVCSDETIEIFSFIVSNFYEIEDCIFEDDDKISIPGENYESYLRMYENIINSIDSFKAWAAC